MTIQELKDKNLLLFECISGSKAYGLATATSDTDIKGVFYLPKEQFYGLNYIAQINNDSNDEVYYELGRFVELLTKNNPNILEMLASPDHCILYKHPLMKHLPVELFLSKQCKDTFAGYAASQIKKAKGYNKKAMNPIEKERKSLLDFCYIVNGSTSVHFSTWLSDRQYLHSHCGLSVIPHTKGMFALYYDPSGTVGYKGVISGDMANEVSLSSIPKDAIQEAYLYCNIEAYSAYCQTYREYWEWVTKRNDTRYTANKAHGKNYDAKNMMHVIRLLEVADEIFKEGKLNVQRKNRETLLKIKNGDFEYNDLLQMADQLMCRIETNFKESDLKEEVDKSVANGILVEMRKALYH